MEILSFVHFCSFGLSKLLLDEECPEVGELPGASDTKNGKLNQSPTDNTGICRL